jgi:ribosomal protein S27AE
MNELENKIKLKICPRCGSTDIDWIIPQNWSTWLCKKCDYVGPIIEGDEKLAKQIKEDYENPKNECLEEEKELSGEELEKKLDDLYGL